uniref:Uncharacterized protein n=1 Tax=Romanomermis culicivorax TaxID=13658 RepID=A0A915HZ34_ROMCU
MTIYFRIVDSTDTRSKVEKSHLYLPFPTERNGTDRQQLETFGLKIHFRSECIIQFCEKLPTVIFKQPTCIPLRTYDPSFALHSVSSEKDSE